MTIQKRVTFDFETRSSCDLKKTGAFKYSLHPSTRATCMSYKTREDVEPSQLQFDEIDLPWRELPLTFRNTWVNWIIEGALFVAHNAFFETCIYKNILVDRRGWPDIPFRQFRCTAAKAAALSLPRSLEGAGSALKLTTQKDFRGYAAMMATCKPSASYRAWHKIKSDIERRSELGKKPTPKQQKWIEKAAPCPAEFLAPEDNPPVWDTLYTYCDIDVKTEELLDQTLPDLSPREQEIWFLNQKVNWRGLLLDVPLAKKIVDLMALESSRKLAELDKLTMGLITKAGSRKKILEFLAFDGIELPDIKAQTVEDVLKGDGVSPDMRRLLEIKKALTKSSTAKFQTMVDRAVETDHRARDLIMYHGAVPTGRDTGMGIQPHNFPARGLIPIDPARPYAAVENATELDEEMLHLLYGENLSFLFSSILRNMILPTPGYELFVGDYSKVELAVLWWLADHQAGLDILRAGKDPYRYQAAENLGVNYEDIAKDSPARNLGKAQILGCGFRMGWKRFQESAWITQRLKLTSRQSYDAVKNYRTSNAPVVKLWDLYEDAAINATENPGRVYAAGKCRFQSTSGYLWITLPSGRNMAYSSPSITYRVMTFTALEKDANGNDIEVEKTSEPKKTLQILGLAPSKKELRTEFLHGGIITENIVQGSARDNMKQGELNLEAGGYRMLISVHDEAVSERKIGEGNLEEFSALLCKQKKWARGLPLTAESWKGPRYRK